MSEVTTLVAAGLVYTALVMWATKPAHTCALVPETHRHLNLQRAVDREHLEQDARNIFRIANRYAERTGMPALDCEETLAHDVMQTHDVTREQLRPVR